MDPEMIKSKLPWGFDIPVKFVTKEDLLSDFPMNRRDEIKKKLKSISEGDFPGDEEKAHIEADKLLLELINDPEITEYFNNIEKWYA